MLVWGCNAIFDSLAILQTEVDQRLGHLDRKYLTPEDVTAAAIETLAFRGLEAAQSQFGRTSKRVPFIPSSRDSRVTQASTMAVPSYLERRVSGPPNAVWQIVHATHPSALSEAADYRSAWYTDEQGLHLVLNYDPGGTWHRLWYYEDPAFAKALTDPLGLPTRFGYLFLHDTILNVINVVMNRAAQLSKDEELSSSQLGAISAQISHSQAQVDKWAPLWESERNASRAPRGRNRRPVLRMMGRG